MAQIHVDIVSAEGHIHKGEAVMVFAPAEMGEVGIAPRHSPLLTRLKPGVVRVKTPSGEELQIFVSGGILEVQPHLVTVLADTALRAKDADEASALRAKQGMWTLFGEHGQVLKRGHDLANVLAPMERRLLKAVD